jgi:hypothetical protein
MDWTAWYWWAGMAVVLVVLLLLLRKGGFRLGAEAFGAKVEVEGKGEGTAGERAPKPGTIRATPAPATARGKGNIAVGGNATGTFVAGDHNRVDGDGDH